MTIPRNRIQQLRALLAELPADDVLQALGFKRLAGLLYRLGPERAEAVLDYACPFELNDDPAPFEDHLEDRDAYALVLTKAELDKTLGRRHCEHRTEDEFDFHATCHPTGRMRVGYHRGVLRFRCAECERYDDGGPGRVGTRSAPSPPSSLGRESLMTDSDSDCPSDRARGPRRRGDAV
jgi:hypothetical protein